MTSRPFLTRFRRHWWLRRRRRGGRGVVFDTEPGLVFSDRAAAVLSVGDLRSFANIS